MNIKAIDAKLMQKIFLAAAQSIDAKKDYINELNVFPVPDGDTGTNMTMTIMAAAREVNAIANPTMESLAKAISGGSLRGARGNSGVILSQLFRGFTKVIKEADVITVPVAAAAFNKAVETAYKAVMKPKEGTILTVARGGAEKASELVGTTEDLLLFAEQIIAHMETVLEHTPELLPVLKEAGVVDSGGQGLVEVMKGGFEALSGKEVVFEGETAPAASSKAPISTENISTSDIKFGYCTEFIILLEKEFTENDEASFKAFLESIGDSIVCVADDDVVKVHVHTNDPGLAIQKALTFGQLSRMKIDNMREEHNEKLFKEQEAAQAATSAVPETPAERKTNGFIAVSVGEGLDVIFKDLGVDEMISGGQTMNPSTEDMLNAIEKINADNIFILPNNKNIILAAEQARSLVSDKNVYVIPSKSVPQGIAAMIGFVPDKSAWDNAQGMTEATLSVKTGQVTYAVRDTRIDGMDISMGDYMGLDDKTVKSVGKDLKTAAIELAESMIDGDSELFSIYFGEECTEEDAQSIADAIEANHRMLDIEVHAGGQPIYYYIMSVE